MNCQKKKEEPNKLFCPFPRNLSTLCININIFSKAPNFNKCSGSCKGQQGKQDIYQLWDMFDEWINEMSVYYMFTLDLHDIALQEQAEGPYRF